jgi:hypothetical protein
MRVVLTLHSKRKDREMRLEVRLDLWKLVATGLLIAALFH